MMTYCLSMFNALPFPVTGKWTIMRQWPLEEAYTS